MTDRLLVLCYHNVRASWCFPSEGDQGLRGLERQLRALQRVANVLPLEDALMRLSEGRRLPRLAVALSFDDGYADNLELVVPRLERLSLPATFFLVPGLLSRTVSAWWETMGWAFTATTRAELKWQGAQHRLDTPAGRSSAQAAVVQVLKRRNRAAREEAVVELIARLAPAGPRPDPQMFLDWAGARRLVRRGHAIGSHSSHHAILSQEDEFEQAADLKEARRLLEEELGVPTPLLAYPNGTVDDYNTATMRAALSADHRFALTTVEGFNRPDTPPHEIRRSFMLPQRGVVDLVANLRYLTAGTHGRALPTWRRRSVRRAPGTE